jgi:hypothetical protein
MLDTQRHAGKSRARARLRFHRLVGFEGETADSFRERLSSRVVPAEKTRYFYGIHDRRFGPRRA